MINDNSDVTMTWGVNYKDWSLYKTEVSGRHVLVLQEKKIYLYIYTLWKWRASLSKRSGQPSTLTFLRPHSLKPCSWRVSEPESLSARRARETHPGAQILWVVG